MRVKLGLKRTFIYILSTILLLNIPLHYIEGKSFCLLFNCIRIECFGCGMARALFNTLHLNIRTAMNYNLFAAVLFQLFIVIILEDVFRTIRLSLSKNKSFVRYSIIERSILLIKSLFGTSYKL